MRRAAAAGRFTKDRISIEICDRFWPYEKPPVEEFGIDQDHYVQQVRQMLLRPAFVRSTFSAADERHAICTPTGRASPHAERGFAGLAAAVAPTRAVRSGSRGPFERPSSRGRACRRDFLINFFSAA